MTHRWVTLDCSVGRCASQVSHLFSEKKSSYYSCLRRMVKWYWKIIIEIICGTCQVNAWYIHKKWGSKKFPILKFREQIIDHLLIKDHHREIEEAKIEKRNPSRRLKHFLQSFKGAARNTRKRCKECYKQLSKIQGRLYAAKKSKKVSTYCKRCKGQPALCLECF